MYEYSDIRDTLGLIKMFTYILTFGNILYVSRIVDILTYSFWSINYDLWKKRKFEAKNCTEMRNTSGYE